MTHQETCGPFTPNGKSAVIDIDTWLGRIRIVFATCRFCLLRVYLPGTFPVGKKECAFKIPPKQGEGRECSCQTDSVRRMILDYFDRKKPIDTPWQWLCFEKLSVLQKRVLEVTSWIPFSGVRSYGDIAEEMGIPGGARFVGNALAANPYPLFIPCHRVIRSNGTAGGFGGGSDMKIRLLEHEGLLKHSRVALFK